jgi:hypothetical protein
MASQTAADILVETLLDWGVDTIFGIPGDGKCVLGSSKMQQADDAAKGVPRSDGLR